MAGEPTGGPRWPGAPRPLTVRLQPGRRRRQLAALAVAGRHRHPVAGRRAARTTPTSRPGPGPWNPAPSWPGWPVGSRRPELGLSAAVLPLRDVTWLAKQAMTLDHVSGRPVHPRRGPGLLAGRIGRARVRPRRAGGTLRRWARRPAGRVRRTVPRRSVRHVPAGLAPGPLTAGRSARVAGREPGPPWSGRSTAGLPFQASRISPDDLAPLARRWQDGGGGLLGVRIRIGLDRVASRADGVDWQALTGPADFLADGAWRRYADLGVGRPLAATRAGRPLVAAPRSRRWSSTSSRCSPPGPARVERTRGDPGSRRTASAGQRVEGVVGCERGRQPEPVGDAVDVVVVGNDVVEVEQLRDRRGPRSAARRCPPR